MFIRNEWARKGTLIAFLSSLDRITKLMDGGSVLVVKYMGPESLLMWRLVTAACKVSSDWLKLAQGHVLGKGG